MEHPFISFVIPVYNRAEDIRVCIESIVSTAADSYEIIIVDDCSTDSTAEVCDQIAAENSNIIVIHKERNGGVGAARNTGIAAARGEYLFFVDSDDVVIADGFHHLLSRRQVWAGVDLVSFNYLTVYGSTEKACAPNDLEEKTEVDKWLEKVCQYSLFNMWQYLFRRTFLLEHSIVCPPLNLGEDAIFTLQARLSAETVFACPELVYQYMVLGNSDSLASKVDSQKLKLVTEGFQNCKRLYSGKALSSIKKSLLERLVALKYLELIGYIPMAEFQLKLNDDLLLADAWDRMKQRVIRETNDFSYPTFICPAGNASIALSEKMIASGMQLKGFLDNAKTGAILLNNGEEEKCELPISSFEILKDSNATNQVRIILFAVTDAAESIRRQLETMGFHVGEEVILLSE